MNVRGGNDAAAALSPIDDAALRTLRRVVVFGGTFDPPHTAHLRLSALVRDALRSADGGEWTVLWVPAGRSPWKRDAAQSPPVDRLQMALLATAGVPGLRVWDYEARAGDGRPTYTIDTVAALRERLRAGAELRLLIGADQALTLAQWREADRLVELAPPVALARPPHDAASLRAALRADGAPCLQRVEVLDAPLIDISATQLRAALRRGDDVGDLLPAAVRHYAVQHGLYGTPSREPRKITDGAG